MYTVNNKKNKKTYSFGRIDTVLFTKNLFL